MVLLGFDSILLHKLDSIFHCSGLTKSYLSVSPESYCGCDLCFILLFCRYLDYIVSRTIFLKSEYTRTKCKNKKKFWAELITYFPMIRHRLHGKWFVQHFFYWCMSILCHGNTFTKILLSNSKGIHWHGGSTVIS